MEAREGPYPGEWQLPTSGRTSGETLPVAAAAAALVVPGVFVPPVSRPWPAGGLGGLLQLLCPFSSLPAEGLRGVGRHRCSGRRRGRTPLGLRTSSPWQRPRPRGRAGAGEIARLHPPTVASPQPGPGGRAGWCSGGVEGRGAGAGGRPWVDRPWVARRTLSHPPVWATTGRASGDGARTGLLHFSRPNVECFSGCF